MKEKIIVLLFSVPIYLIIVKESFFIFITFGGEKLTFKKDSKQYWKDVWDYIKL